MRKRSSIFEVTQDHLTLLSCTCIDWFDCEYGAPSINPKRPYGNSDVESDVCERLGWQANDDGEYSEAQLENAGKLHKETEVALQICLSRLKFETGVFVTTDDICFRTWTPA